MILDPRLLPLAGLGLLALVKSRSGSSARIAPPSRRLPDWSKGSRWVRDICHDTPVLSVAFSPDGGRLGVGGGRHGEPHGHFAYVVHLNTGLDALYRRYMAPVLSVAFSQDGRYFAVGGEDGRARVYDIETGSPDFDEEMSGFVNAVAFVPGSSRSLVVGDDGNRVQVLNVRSTWPSFIRAFGSSVHAVAVSADGRLLAGGDGLGDVVVSSLVPAGPKDAVWRIEEKVNAVSLSPDGRLLAVGAENGIARVLDVASGLRVAAFDRVDPTRAFSNEAWFVVFSPDGRHLAMGSLGGRLQICETATWRVVLTLEFGEPVMSIAFSPDGRRIAVGVGSLAQIFEVNP